MDFKYDNIPKELRDCKQWGLFKLKYVPKRKKNTKIPLNSYNGKAAKSNDPTTWSEFDVALRALKKYKADGLAFFFANGFVGLDIDDIDDELANYRAGDPDTLVSEFRKLTNKTYMEISQSGKGIHAIFKGKIPGRRRHHGKFEMYESGRFFALTGWTIGFKHDIQRLNKDQMERLYERIFGKDKIINIPNDYSHPINNLTVPEIINRMLSSAKGQRDKLFMNGGWEGLYTSHSEADMAFANDLAFWTGKDFQKMDTIFRNSSLMREKWDRKDGATTYGVATLNKAINETVNTFSTHAEGEDVPDVYGFNKPLKQKKKLPARSWDDMGMAQRMLDRFPHKFMYSTEDRMWYIYNGSYWEQDKQLLIGKLADIVIDGLAKEKPTVPADMDEKKAEKAWHKFIKQRRSDNARKNMLDTLKHLVPVLHNQWDKEKMLLNTPSGYVDLTTGKLFDHDYKKMFTQETGVDFSDKTDCPLWIEFLNQTFEGDQELIHFVQKALGYSITGSTSEQKMFIPLGNGRNGKSVMINIVKYVLGSYAKSMNAASIMRKQNNNSNGPSSDIARLENARVVLSSEANEGDRLDESLVKQMTGGDTMVARYSYGRDFEFTPVFKLWMATNHIPKIYGTDEGIWRRIVIIPFKHTVPEDQIDTDLENKLKAESMGILKWMIDGALMWQSEKLKKVPKAIKEANEERRQEMDVIEAFVAEQCVVRPGLNVRAIELFDAYKDWAKDTNNWDMSNTQFGIKMSARFKKKKLSGGLSYQGIDLASNQQYKFNK